MIILREDIPSYKNDDFLDKVMVFNQTMMDHKNSVYGYDCPYDEYLCDEDKNIDMKKVNQMTEVLLSYVVFLYGDNYITKEFLRFWKVAIKSLLLYCADNISFPDEYCRTFESIIQISHMMQESPYHYSIMWREALILMSPNHLSISISENEDGSHTFNAATIQPVPLDKREKHEEDWKKIFPNSKLVEEIRKCHSRFQMFADRIPPSFPNIIETAITRFLYDEGLTLLDEAVEPCYWFNEDEHTED